MLRQTTHGSTEPSFASWKLAHTPSQMLPISLVNPAPLRHFILFPCYLFPLYLFRRALWRRRRTHKARPHFFLVDRHELNSMGKKQGEMDGQEKHSSSRSLLQPHGYSRAGTRQTQPWIPAGVTWGYDTHLLRSFLNVHISTSAHTCKVTSGSILYRKEQQHHSTLAPLKPQNHYGHLHKLWKDF